MYEQQGAKSLVLRQVKQSVSFVPKHQFLDFSGVYHQDGYGLQRWTKRGYRQTSRMWCRSRIQVRNRSNPKPYPPWGHVPYFLCEIKNTEIKHFLVIYATVAVIPPKQKKKKKITQTLKKKPFQHHLLHDWRGIQMMLFSGKVFSSRISWGKVRTRRGKWKEEAVTTLFQPPPFLLSLNEIELFESEKISVLLCSRNVAQ